jgi:hypothetical protein
LEGPRGKSVELRVRRGVKRPDELVGPERTTQDDKGERGRLVAGTAKKVGADAVNPFILGPLSNYPCNQFYAISPQRKRDDA